MPDKPTLLCVAVDELDHAMSALSVGFVEVVSEN